MCLCSFYFFLLTTTTTERLIGAALLAFVEARNADHVKQNTTLDRTAMCIDAGYCKDAKPQFTDFYVALMDAKGIPSEPSDYVKEVNEWYDNLSEEQQSLCDMIVERCPEFEKSDVEDFQGFIDKLADDGITTADQFEDAYFHCEDYRHDESHYGEFVEHIVTELSCEQLPEFLVIDWQASWYSAYQHDFMDIEHDRVVYFFHSHF